MARDILVKLDGSDTLPDIFEAVKAAVWQARHKSRGGLMLGVADLGNSPGGFLGAFYPVGTNVIVMNRVPMLRIKQTSPELYKPYVFHVLMHEYLHALGELDEKTVYRDVFLICRELLGASHPATKIAKSPARFIPNLSYPDASWRPDHLDIEFIEGFDRSAAAGYIG